MSNILKGIVNESRYPEDPDEWEAMFGTRHKLKPEEPNIEDPQDPWADHYRRQDTAQAKYKKEVNIEHVNKEGVAPNGERYNSAFIIHSKTPQQADQEIYKFNDLNWGAKKIVDTTKKKPESEGQPFATIVYYVDNHKHGYWKPWKDEEPISKGVQFSEEIMREGISQQDLADTLYHRLEMRYPDIVTRYGHDVIGDAVMDVAGFHAGAEELGTSDIGIMIREIIKNLENYAQNGSLDEAQKEVDYDSEWDDKVSRLGQLAKEGPREIVWDPVKRVYKTVPVNLPKKDQGVAEADKHSFIGKIQRHNELKKKVDSSWKDIGDAQKAGDKEAGSKAFRKHERYANLERPGTWTKVDEQGEGVAEGLSNDYQQGVDDGVEYFLYTDGEGDTIKDVFLQMKRSTTEPKSKEYWRGVADGMRSVQDDQGVAGGFVTEAPHTFAGKDPMSFKSPKGGAPTMMIVTGQGSRYLITSDGMVLRNKSFHANTGGEDQGLKNWSDAIEFYDPTELPGGVSFPMSVAKAVEKRLPVSLSKTSDGKRALIIHDGSQWRIAKISDIYKNVASTDAPIVGTYSTTPKLNWNVLDYNTGPNRTLTSVHPGSPVTHGIKLDKQGVAEGERIKTSSNSYYDLHTGIEHSSPTGNGGHSGYMTPAYMMNHYKERLADIAASPYKRPREVAQLKAKIARLEKQGVAEGENWSKHNNPRAGGMSKKSVSSYRRSHPGSKIQTAVTTKPSKIKKGSKDAARRKSFCARMKGMKKHRTGAKTARDPNSNINKSLRRWHCESVEELQQLVMIAEQKVKGLREAAKPAQQAAIAINMKKKGQKPKNESSIEKGLQNEGVGLPYPGTYEQETKPLRIKGQERKQAIAFEGNKNVSRRT